MRTVLLTLLITWTVAVGAQTAGTARIGTWFLDGAPVECTTLEFDKRLYSMKLCEKGNYLMLMFRNTDKKGKTWKNKGEISVLNLDDMTVAWTRPFNYGTTSAIPTSQGVLTCSGNVITMLSAATGNDIWRHECCLAQVDDRTGVVMAYDHAGSKHLRGYSFKNGQELWEIRVPHNEGWGWNDVELLDSTWLMVVNDDLTLFNPLTGENYQYKAKTGITDTKGLLLSSLAALGAVAGAALAGSMGGGYYYYPAYIGNNVITGLHSNLCHLEGGDWLFADRRKLVRLDAQLNPVWEHELPEKTAAHSILLTDDSLVYMLNMGVGWANASARKAGRPFIAAYNVTDGEEVYMNMLSSSKDIIVDALFTPDGLFMMDDEALSYKRSLDNASVSQSTWNTASHGHLARIIDTPVYSHSEGGSTFELIPYDGQNCPVMNDRGTVFVVNKDLRIWKEYAPQEQYYTLFDVGDHRWVNRAYPTQDIWMISQLGLPEVHINVQLRKLVQSHDMVYAISDDKLFLIRL